jgi:hypothetical protein
MKKTPRQAALHDIPNILRHMTAHVRVVSVGAMLLSFAGCGGRALQSSGPSGTSEPSEPPAAEPGPAPTSSVLLFGGVTSSNDTLGDTWSWTDRDGWKELHPASSPPPRYGAMAARARADLVLFGGATKEPSAPRTGETWTWDGASWAPRQPSGSPPALTDSVLAPAGEGLLLFGGYDEGAIYRDVWRWDGAAWSHLSPAVTPSAREAPAGGVVDGSLVIFGGEDDTLLPIGDTWVFDGSSLKEAHPAHTPPPRRGASAVAFQHKLVLFGGDTISPSGGWSSVNDTWVWDGSDWTEVALSSSPDPRSFAGMAAAGDVVVLFGGGSFGGEGNQPSGTWTWDGMRWTKRAGPDPTPRNYPTLASW